MHTHILTDCSTWTTKVGGTYVRVVNVGNDINAIFEHYALQNGLRDWTSSVCPAEDNY